MSADFWSSYASGAIGILIGNPLDVIKTRIQAYSSGSSSATTTSPSSSVASRPSSNFSGFSSYLRGAPAPLLGYGALNSILFVTYNRTLTLLGEEDFSNPRSLGKVWLAGAAGGLASFVVSAPTELVKCRVQVLEQAASGQKLNSWTTATDIFRREGIRGLYFGGAITSIRDSVGYGFYFWSYELLKQSWSRKDESDREAALKVLICGGIAGVATWASIFPMDVIKTRVQTQPWSQTAPVGGEGQALLEGTANRSRLGAIQVARQTYQNEGIAVFFRGLGVCSVRAFIVNAIQWAVYEWMMQILRKGN